MIKLVSIKDAVREAKEYIKGRSSGEIKSIKTCLEDLNEGGVNGLEWGNIITLAGMSGSGKTAVASIIESSIYDLNPEEKITGLNFSFEMKAFRLVGRKISSELKISTSELYSAESKFNNFDKLDDIGKDLEKYNIYYLEDYTTAVGIKNVIMSLYNKLNPERKEKILDEHGLIVIIDHSILVKMDKTKESSRLEALHNLCEILNDLKKKIKIITFILSQLNRSIESSERRDITKNQILHFPTKSDIYGGDSLYQFSDIVAIIHRPEMLNVMFYGPNAWKSENKIFIHFLKFREGEPTIALYENELKYNNIKKLNSLE